LEGGVTRIRKPGSDVFRTVKWVVALWTSCGVVWVLAVTVTSQAPICEEALMFMLVAQVLVPAGGRDQALEVTLGAGEPEGLTEYSRETGPAKLSSGEILRSIDDPAEGTLDKSVGEMLMPKSPTVTTSGVEAGETID